MSSVQRMIHCINYCSENIKQIYAPPSPKILNYCIFKYYVLTGIAVLRKPSFFSADDGIEMCTIF